MPTGTIVRLAPNHRSGVISVDESGEEVFFQRVSLVDVPVSEISIGRRLHFELKRQRQHRDRNYAVAIRKASEHRG